MGRIHTSISTQKCTTCSILSVWDSKLQEHLFTQDEHKHVPDMLKLSCFEGPSAGMEFSKPGVTLSIGRTKASKIWIHDPVVSEKHGKLEWTGQSWQLYDIGSSNGTKVNGTTLEPEGKSPTQHPYLGASLRSQGTSKKANQVRQYLSRGDKMLVKNGQPTKVL